MMCSSLIFESDTKTTQCVLYSVCISVQTSTLLQGYKNEHGLVHTPDFGRRYYSFWDTYSGLPLRHTDRTLDITYPVVLSSWDIEVIRDSTVLVQMDP